MDEPKDQLEIEDIPEEDEVVIEYDIATFPSDFTLWGIYDKYQNHEIYIPEFQREFVWNIRQSSLLIESFLLGLPVPPVFLYIDPKNRLQVIDGQQRILSFCYFFEGFFGSENLRGSRQVFRLKGLDEKNPYHNRRYEDLDESDQRKLKDSVLRAINVRQLSPKEDNSSVYHIFERLNTGGTPLQPQEIRNCVYRGDFAGMLRKLNTDDNWRAILGKKVLDRHQRDVELVLRTFSLWLYANSYEKPMKEFLNKTMDSHKEGNSKEVQHFIDLFPRAAKYIISQLGMKPFHVRGPLNTSTLDAVFYVVLTYFEKMPLDFKDRYNLLINHDDFEALTTIGTTDYSVVSARLKLAQKTFLEPN